MHKVISRRNFLGLLGGAIGSSMFSSVLTPSLLMAQSQVGGSNKNLIFVNLLGGLDGLAAFPYYEGPISTLINGSLRPSLFIPPGQVLALNGQSGLPNKIGLHPAFQNLATHSAGNLKVVRGYGIPGDLDRSHDTCQILMSLGATRLAAGDMSGFMARLMDRQNWESFQFWALAVTNPPDINTRKKPPILVNDLSNLDFPPIGWEGTEDLAQAIDVNRELIELQIPRSPLEERYRSVQRSTDQVISKVRRDINHQIVGNNPAGNYDDSEIGRNLRDAAKILRAKKFAPESGLAGRETLLLCAQSGYDTHSDQHTTDPASGGLPQLLANLGNNLAVFYKDLENFGILQDTLIIVYSEFGRTNFENGAPGAASTGTDHGHASNTLVLGGPVHAGVCGDTPTGAELQDADYNALLPKIDYRDVFSDAMRWLGVNPSDIFDEAGYVPGISGILE